MNWDIFRLILEGFAIGSAIGLAGLTASVLHDLSKTLRHVNAELNDIAQTLRDEVYTDELAEDVTTKEH